MSSQWMTADENEDELVADYLPAWFPYAVTLLLIALVVAVSIVGMSIADAIDGVEPHAEQIWMYPDASFPEMINPEAGDER